MRDGEKEVEGQGKREGARSGVEGGGKGKIVGEGGREEEVEREKKRKGGGGGGRLREKFLMKLHKFNIK